MKYFKPLPLSIRYHAYVELIVGVGVPLSYFILLPETPVASYKYLLLCTDIIVYWSAVIFELFPTAGALPSGSASYVMIAELADE